MRYFSRKRGEDEEKWGVIGLVHDWIMSSSLPSTAAKQNRFSENEDARGLHSLRREPRMGICSNVEPQSAMEKILYAIDELTGLVATTALVRPSKAFSNMTAKSVQKKWKDKRFAAGVDRSIIEKGAQMLGMDLGEMITDTIVGMRSR